MLIPIFSPRVVASVYEAESDAYFAAMTSAPDDTRKGLLNDYILSLKNDGIYSKLRWFSIFAAHDSQAARINVIVPSEVASVVNSPTFTTDRGYTGDGVSAGLNTGLAANVVINKDDATFFAYVRTEATTGTNIMGYESSRGRIVHSTSSTNVGGTIHTNNSSVRSTSDPNQFIAVRRTGTSQTVSINTANGTTVAVTDNNTGFTNTMRFLGSPSSFSNTQLSIGGFGTFLTDTERNNFVTHTNTYLTAVGAI